MFLGMQNYSVSALYVFLPGIIIELLLLLAFNKEDITGHPDIQGCRKNPHGRNRLKAYAHEYQIVKKLNGR
jgi:hypothetical protein